MRVRSSISQAVRRSVRRKLLALTLIPVALILPLALVVLTGWGASFTYDQLYIKVNTDLAVARDVFERVQRDMLAQLARLSDSYRFRKAMAEHDQAVVQAQIADLKSAADFSFLRVIPVADLAPDESYAPGVSIQVLGPDRLRDIDPRLAAAVRLHLLQTRHARPTERRLEDRGLLIRARQPVLSAGGHLVAVLDGGVLLNNNFAFVDTLRDLVYGPGSLPPGSLGTVTVMLDDVRISTNVPRRAGERALGTRVSEEVSNAVLGRGETWIGRAFVVNDWYISAYRPILDAGGARIGILHAGFLEAPYRTTLWTTLGLVLLLVLGLLGLYALLAIRGAKSIFHPVERMSQVVTATRLGESARVGDVASEDELADLAREFDAMLDRLERQAAAMQDWAAGLEDKVAERTVELQQRNDELQRTITALRDARRQLIDAEKLAALGELTAGVAHEINNPTQVMLGHLDLLVAELGDAAGPVRPQIDLIIEQVYRVQAIIEKLLKYARPGEYAGHLTEVDVNRLVQDSLGLVSHLQKRHAFGLTCALAATRTILISEQELQQVLVNLLTNAVHALPPVEGRIVLGVEDWEDHGVCVTVTDNGCGMDPETCDRVFNPFYSTKPPGKGTGLGLSVSYALVRRYGGDITVESEPGHGSRFRVWLLSRPQMIEDAQTIAEQLHGHRRYEPAAARLRPSGGARG